MRDTVKSHKPTTIDEQNLHITITPIDNYWLATVSDKKGKWVREFLGHNKEFTQWKANFFVLCVANHESEKIQNMPNLAQMNY